MAEEAPTLINVDVLAACRGIAQQAAAELGVTLPDCELRTDTVAALSGVAEVFDDLMAHAAHTGVGELDADDLPTLEDVDLAEPKAPAKKTTAAKKAPAKHTPAG